MKSFFLFLMPLTVFASDPLFTSVTYYEALDQKFRVETASNWPKCKESKRARKIYLHKPNELREVAYWDEKGKIHEAGKDNNPEVHRVVNEIFARSQISGNPCDEKKDPVEEKELSDSPKGSLQ